MIETKPEISHKWTIFSKGRMRVEACSICGDVHLPSNTDNQCSDNELIESQIFKAGYNMLSEIEDSIENVA